MTTYISAIKIGTVDRLGVFKCKVTLGNIRGVSDDDMKIEADRVVNEWTGRGFDVQTKITRNYRLSLEG